jgi:tRNA nucleotidyltransferase (CCA-adding enzyme)
MKKINSVLEEVLQKIKPDREEINFLQKELDKFLIYFNSKSKKLKIDAEIFVGGSFAKKTIMKKGNYDIDLFVRFDKRYLEKELSILTKKILGKINNLEEIHGSRDYFRIKIGDRFYFEIVPVVKVNNPKEARNITDLSYSHVKYINKKIKNQRLIDEILIAKAFCHATGTYGAESYINGFSGYSLELLIYKYKSFVKFIEAMVRIKDKLVIDVEKYYRKDRAMIDMNSSKLNSPVILVDPTYKQRNALAALSKETFIKFQEESIKFLKNPSLEFFEPRKIDLVKLKAKSKKEKNDFVLLQASTKKQEGDIAGSKLFKFYRHMEEELKKFFEIKEKGFNYNSKQAARFYFVAKPKKEITLEGPFVEDKKNVKKFKSEHKNTFIKKKKIYSKMKVDFDLKKFLDKWKNKNKDRIKEMYIDKFEIIED